MANETDTQSYGRLRGIVVFGAAYLIALGAAVAVGYSLRTLHPLLMVFAADAAATVVIFLFSLAFKNSSFYDPFWSVQPMVIAAYWALAPLSDGVDELRVDVLVGLVWLYGARLTYNFLRGWTGLKHEDWRYVDLQAQHGRAYWLVSFSGIHFFPTVLVYLGCLPLYTALTTPDRPFGALDGIATLVTFGAIAIEGIADNQLRRFRLSNPDPQRILETGLWRYSRHPNYFGEVMFWWGLFLFAMAADPNAWWTVIGAGSITILFAFISIPMIDKRHLERRPSYAKRMKTTSAIVPWFPK